MQPLYLGNATDASLIRRSWFAVPIARLAQAARFFAQFESHDHEVA